MKHCSHKAPLRLLVASALASVSMMASAQCPGIRPAFKWSSLGLELLFSDTTDTHGLMPDSVNWDFGDGSVALQTSMPDHVYSTAGTDLVRMDLWVAGCLFSVTAEVTHGEGTDLCTTTIYPFFSTQLVANNAVLFNTGITATSDIALSSSWDFRDGSPYGSGLSPEHFYLLPGLYAPVLSLVGVDSTTMDNCVAGMVRTIAVDGNASTCDSSVFADFTLTSFGSAVQVDAQISYFTTATVADGLVWSFGDQSGDLTSVTSAFHDYVYSGDYQVCFQLNVIDTVAEDSCWVLVCRSVEEALVGIEEDVAAAPLHVFPVPFSDQLNIRDERLEGLVRLRVIGMAGALVAEAYLQYDHGVAIDLGKLPAGVYVLEARSGDTSLRCRAVKY